MNKFLEKIASWKDHPVRAAQGIAKAWKETPGPARLSMGLSGASLAVGTANYENSVARTQRQNKANDIEGKSLNVLKDIHKTLAEKQASAKKPDWVSERPEQAEGVRNMAIVGSAGASVTGAGLAQHAYHRGDLTGRETLYHGSSEQSIKDIRQHGLKPNKGGGASGLKGIDLDEKNKNLVFATRRKRDAKVYAHQQEAIHLGKVTDSETLKVHQQKAQLGIHGKYGSNKYIAKINMPTWKDEYKSGVNPELRKLLKERKKNPFAFMDRPAGMTENQYKKNLVRQFQGTVHVQRGEKGIGTEFIKGSPNYKGNSMKEIGEYITHNKGRFAKGVGKAVGGAALAVGGAVGMYQAHKKLTPDEY
jgi:hypothetical protein